MSSSVSSGFSQANLSSTPMVSGLLKRFFKEFLLLLLTVVQSRRTEYMPPYQLCRAGYRRYLYCIQQNHCIQKINTIWCRLKRDHEITMFSVEIFNELSYTYEELSQQVDRHICALEAATLVLSCTKCNLCRLLSFYTVAN